MTDQSDATPQAAQGFEPVKHKRKRKINAVDMEEQTEIKRPSFPPVDASVSSVGALHDQSYHSWFVFSPSSRAEGLSLEVFRFHHIGLRRSKKTG